MAALDSVAGGVKPTVWVPYERPVSKWDSQREKDILLKVNINSRHFHFPPQYSLQDYVDIRGKFFVAGSVPAQDDCFIIDQKFTLISYLIVS